MRILAHISDLHFGRLNPGAPPALRASIAASGADVVVVSGDLTQRARAREFAAARRFLDSLSVPWIVVPGNHDVPLYDIFSRWLNPLGRYRQYISDDVEPFYADREIAVLGINTARSLTFKNGRINRDQVRRGCALLGGCADTVTRIIVTHHPFDLPATNGHDEVVGRASMAIEGFARCRVDLILSGHLHHSQTGATTLRYGDTGYSAVLVQAGTATSSRQRTELNSYNVISIDRPRLSIDRMVWEDQSGAFAVTGSDHFRLAPLGWARSANTAEPGM